MKMVRGARAQYCSGERCGPYEGEGHREGHKYTRSGWEVQTVNWNANDLVDVDPFESI